MLNWHPKDPDEVLDYRWEPVIDAGDTIASITLSRLSGDVVTDSAAEDATGITLVLSGGTDGSNVFRGLASTVGGRTFEEYITLPVVSKPDAGLVASLKARYPAFAAVDAATIAYWLTDADRYVGAWGDDRDVGLMSIAARNMVAAKVAGIASSDASGLGGSGVTSFRSGSFSAQITEDAANGKLTGLWDDDWAALVRIYGTGLGVASPGFAPCVYGYRESLLGYQL